MKYFTPELMARLDSTDPDEASAADAEWDRRQEEYEAELRRIGPTLPDSVRAFNDLLLHDARVYSLARQGDQLILVMQKDVPPRDLVIVTYDLIGEPVIDTEALSAGERSPVMDFLYDEFGVVQEGGAPVYEQVILFSNGWEVRLRFRDVRFVVAEPLFPGTSPEPQTRSTTNAPVPAVVRGFYAVGETYADGTEPLFLWMKREDATGLSSGPVQLRIAGVLYRGEVQVFKDYVGISPTLHSTRGEKTTLGHVLGESGFRRNDRVRLEMNNASEREIIDVIRG